MKLFSLTTFSLFVLFISCLVLAKVDPTFDEENPWYDARGMYSSCNRKGTFVFTYDDGPWSYTPTLLDELKAAGITATFFVIGVNLEDPTNVATLQRAYNEGHIIAAHSYTHPSFITLTKAQMVSEMQKTSDIIYSAIGVRPKYFRPPYGDVNELVISTITGMGYKMIVWNLDTNDWQFVDSNPQNNIQVIEQNLPLFNVATKSWIVLQHDTHQNTVLGQPAIYKYVASTGFAIVGLDQCMMDPNRYMSGTTSTTSSSSSKSSSSSSSTKFSSSSKLTTSTSSSKSSSSTKPTSSTKSTSSSSSLSSSSSKTSSSSSSKSSSISSSTSSKSSSSVSSSVSQSTSTKTTSMSLSYIPPSPTCNIAASDLPWAPGATPDQIENPFYDARGLFSSCTTKGSVALTYMGGPSDYTSQILSALSFHNVKATFFVIGSNLADASYVTGLQQIVAAGHEIGTMGYDFVDYTGLTAAAMLADLNKSITTIKNACGVTPKYFAPPYESYNDLVIKTVTGAGFRIAMYNLDTLDWEYADTDPTHSLCVLRTLLPPYGVAPTNKSWIILQNSWSIPSSANQIDIITFIKEYGYNFVTISQADGK